MPTHPPATHQPWSRDDLMTVLPAALQTRAYRFARQIALTWLASYPGDLPVELLYGQVLLGEGRARQAEKVARKLIDRDPAFREAYELLIRSRASARASSDPVALGSWLALGGTPASLHLENFPRPPAWVAPLRDARRALLTADLPRAEAQIQPLLALALDVPLAALTQLRILAARPEPPYPEIESLAAAFRRRWPVCVPCLLLLAEAQLHNGDPDQGVALLHQAAAYDVTGQTARRLWGAEHPYRDLWPLHFSAVIETPVPARVAASLGWNLLPGNEQPAVVSHQPSAAGHQEAAPSKPVFHPIPALKARPANPPSAGKNQKPKAEPPRSPTYVLLSTRQGLQSKYGKAGAAVLETAMQQVAAAVRRKPDWGALVLYADDPAGAARYGIKPAAPGDPWAIKLFLADLDAALARRGRMIGALLIVGGPAVIPFHTLPNPTDDPDVDVPSDNPYATRDENYFIPEWPVGRLPDGAGDNPLMLLGALQSIAADHLSRRVQGVSWRQRFWGWLARLLRRGEKRAPQSFGFSAEVWRKAASAVYRPIAESGRLQTSPPVDVEQRRRPLLEGRLGYFNLHGLADTAEWYGQRDPINGHSGPDYPVALRVQDIRNGGHAPEIVFSEACYGAHILHKRVEESLALRFLHAGSRAVIGSTVMSYGSISTPLNAADLLGMAFWQFLREGSPAGEALRRAKITLAREMHQRQGYLDGEDQKTLISFVLYGDPLAQVTLRDGGENGSKQGKAAPRPSREQFQVKTVCDLGGTDDADVLSEEALLHVKQVVRRYLPGMQGAQMRIAREHVDCDCEEHCCPTAQLGPKTRPERPPERRVVTLSKTIPAKSHAHRVYARLTLDKQGKVVKLAVSR